VVHSLPGARRGTAARRRGSPPGRRSCRGPRWPRWRWRANSCRLCHRQAPSWREPLTVRSRSWVWSAWAVAACI